MSIFTSFAMLLLVMLILLSLQFSPSVFSLFYHSALAKNSRKKADDLSLYFILGVEIFMAIILIFSCLSFSCLSSFENFINSLFPWILAGVSFALSVISFFCYFRKSTTTSLFVSRKIAKSFSEQTKNIKKKSDAFALGFVSGIPELLFTIPLFLIISAEAFKTSFLPGALIIIFCIIIAILPLFVIRTFYRSDFNLADITRLRTKNKPLFRLTLSISYLLLMFLIIYSGIN